MRLSQKGSFFFCAPGMGDNYRVKVLNAPRQWEEPAKGKVYAVDIDLERFFDIVSHSKLIEVLSKTITDGRVVSLIHKYLNAGVMNGGKYEATAAGVPQGGPLSPLLSNILLNELDRELERCGHKFVPYADDMVIFCKSLRSAERTMKSIIPYIEGGLLLKVNRDKSQVNCFSDKV